MHTTFAFFLHVIERKKTIAKRGQESKYGESKYRGLVLQNNLDNQNLTPGPNPTQDRGLVLQNNLGNIFVKKTRFGPGVKT